MADDSLFDDLYRHNDWANCRILRLCEGLSDEQLDQPREMGFGSLRATVFHMLAAEEIWQERWEGIPWRPFDFEPRGLSLNQIATKLQAVSERRRQLIDQERDSQWKRLVTYQNSSRQEGVRRLDDLLLHVANHGVHHRAQALHFLKQLGRTVPVGLDYLLYKFAFPSVKQDAETVAAMRQYGLEVETGTSLIVAFNGPLIQRLFEYHDWANQKLLDAAAPLDDPGLDRDFSMGVGSLRKTLIHLFDVEPWWLKNWNGEAPPFSSSSDPKASLAQLKGDWSRVAAQRNAFIAQLDDGGASQVVPISFGGPPLKFRVVESLIQICMHGTHHRAQLSNMLRQNKVTPPGLDYAAWVQERGL